MPCCGQQVNQQTGAVDGHCPLCGAYTSATNDYVCYNCGIRWVHNTWDAGSLFTGFIFGALLGGYFVYTSSGRAQARAAATTGYGYARTAAERAREEIRRRR